MNSKLISLIQPPDGYADLPNSFPNMKGFSPRNLKYMRTFAHTRTDVKFVQEVLAQLPSIEDIERELMGFDGGDA